MTTSPFILEYHDNDRDNHYQLIASVILTGDAANLLI